jgi:hypothetical protein
MAGYFLPKNIFVNANIPEGIKPPARIATLRG